jgi:hypothetical protein
MFGPASFFGCYPCANSRCGKLDLRGGHVFLRLVGEQPLGDLFEKNAPLNPFGSCDILRS